MSQRPVVHLVCQAHIDPVWMWGWEEGLRETISTFTTAANLLDAFPEFVFNHNESVLYEWVEEYDPPLFARIVAHVRAGRWNITGGWYLQPDVNLTGGETLARVILEGRRYFAEKFGVRPPVSYNFDSFGHPNSLPMLLKQSDFSLYIHCRPVESQMALPSPVYRWRSADGSEVLAVRPDSGWYCTPIPGQAQENARRGVEIARKTGRDTIVLWGLGDHGGGATREDLVAFRALLDEFRNGDVELRHSTTDAYLKSVLLYRDELPIVQGELQRTLSGTYTSVAPIKRQMRHNEALLASAEHWAAAAWWRFGRAYPEHELREAWKRLMFNTFHDTLCGSLVESAIPAVNAMFGYTGDVARRVITKAQLALLPPAEPKPETIPLFVCNPHGSAMRAPVGINFLSAYAPPPKPKAYTLYDDAGARVPSQTQGGDNIHLDEGTWQPFCGFVADVLPMSVRRYEIRFEESSPLAPSRIAVSENDEGIRLETPIWTAWFDRAQAALIELEHKATGRSLLRAPLRLMVMQDVSHAWGGENNVIFNQPVAPMTALSPEEVGAFAGMEGHTGPALRIIARGDAWLTVECLVGWQHTRAAIRHTFYADLPYIDIHTQLYMQARRKMIKLQLPFAMNDAASVCEVPYSVAHYPADATEYPYARWIRVDDAEGSVGIANNGQNGFDVDAKGTLNLSIARGAFHCAWSETDVPTDKSYTIMDQERIDTRFRLLAGATSAETNTALVLAAQELNQPLERFFVYYPPTLPEDAAKNTKPFIHITPASVVLAALKKAEGADALIVRVQETVGVATAAEIGVRGAQLLRVTLPPFAVRTFRLERDGRWAACNLLEEADES